HPRRLSRPAGRAPPSLPGRHRHRPTDTAGENTEEGDSTLTTTAHDGSFNLVPPADGPARPRSFRTTEIRAPYYSTFGTRHLQDVFDVAGPWVDGIKWAGGSFALLPTEQVRKFSDIAHANDAYVSSGGWIETVLRYGDEAVDAYLKE